MSAKTSAKAFLSRTIKWHWSASHLIETCFSRLDINEYSPKQGFTPTSLSGLILEISFRKIPFLQVYFTMLNSMVMSCGSTAVLRTSMLKAHNMFFSSSFKSHSWEANQLGFLISFRFTRMKVLLAAFESLLQTSLLEGRNRSSSWRTTPSLSSLVCLVADGTPLPSLAAAYDSAKEWLLLAASSLEWVESLWTKVTSLTGRPSSSNCSSWWLCIVSIGIASALSRLLFWAATPSWPPFY